MQNGDQGALNIAPATSRGGGRRHGPPLWYILLFLGGAGETPAPDLNFERGSKRVKMCLQSVKISV